MEVMADSALGRNDSPVHEIQIRVERAGLQQGPDLHGTGSVVNGFRNSILGRVRMHDPLGQRLSCWQRGNKNEREKQTLNHLAFSFYPHGIRGGWSRRVFVMPPPYSMKTLSKLHSAAQYDVWSR